MITAKLGGSSVTASNLWHLKQILTPFHKCVVVSAVGKEHRADSKVTDLLVNYFQTGSEVAWQQIADKLKRLATVNAIDIDVDALLFDAKKRARKFDLAYCMSLGEELSAKLVAKFVNATYLEAEQIVRFSNGKFDKKRTYLNVKNALKGVELAVMGGFYGGSDCGRCTFSRGGGDVTGAVVAAASNSLLYENWTDVNGVCVANPTLVHGVSTVDYMSYDEMLLLSRGGAEVLHPDAIAPVREKGIPIKIGNFTNPFGKSTLVSNCPSHCKLLSIAEKRVETNVVTTVLHSFADWEIAQLVSNFLHGYTKQLCYFETVRQVSTLTVYGVEFQSGIVRITTDASILKDLYNHLI